MTQVYKPDLWQLVKFNSTHAPTYHILSSWWGGYANSDSWRLSTQITRIQDYPDHWLVTTSSGSQYELSRRPHRWGTSSLARQVLNQHPVLEPLPNHLLENT